MSQKDLELLANHESFFRPRAVALCTMHSEGVPIEPGFWALNPPPFDSGPVVVPAVDLERERQAAFDRLTAFLASASSEATSARAAYSQVAKDSRKALEAERDRMEQANDYTEYDALFGAHVRRMIGLACFLLYLACRPWPISEWYRAAALDAFGVV